MFPSLRSPVTAPAPHHRQMSGAHERKSHQNGEEKLGPKKIGKKRERDSRQQTADKYPNKGPPNTTRSRQTAPSGRGEIPKKEHDPIFPFFTLFFGGMFFVLLVQRGSQRLRNQGGGWMWMKRKERNQNQKGVGYVLMCAATFLIIWKHVNKAELDHDLPNDVSEKRPVSDIKTLFFLGNGRSTRYFGNQLL
mmetsp:Transcript_30132/g.77787  ORF Transcript_30132/g.77787 Transcript_30132/m.77787 type:complete len:192 (+) Transcript_30132:2691-3266(+)